jgi:hypothetical protein
LRTAKLIVAAGLVAFAIAFGLWWLSGPPVNPSNFARIHDGMPKSEVVALLGEGSPWAHANMKWPERKGEPIRYVGEGYDIVVWYDPAQQVAGKADSDWIYRWTFDVPLRYKIRREFGYLHRAVSE